MRGVKKFFSVIIALTIICTSCLNGEWLMVAFSSSETNCSEKVHWGNSYYQLFDVSMTWTEAKAYCESLGGHLATITSEAEQSFINQELVFKTNCKRQFWLGSYYESGLWKWVTGEKFSYTNWNPGEPTGGQYYLTVLGNYHSGKGKWLDNPNNGCSEPWTLETTGFICEWSGTSFESLIYTNNLPVLSPNDAKQFLGFLYKEDFTNVDLSSDIQYKLLTGNLSGSVDDVKNIISAFCFVVQTLTNSYVNQSSYYNDLCRNSLIERLKKELGGLKTTDQQIIGEYSAKVEEYLKEGITDILSGVVAKCTGIIITTDIVDNLNLAFSGIKTISDIPGKVDELYNRVGMVFDASFMIASQELLGRYSYFNLYLANRSDGDEAYFDFLMDYNFWALSESTYLSKAIDLTTWFTGKDSWTNHRDDLDRWAEYIYQLNRYSEVNPHSYSVVKYEPTCSARGYTYHKCEHCGDSFTDNYVDALGHKYLITTIQPTCTSVGYEIHKCERCGNTKTMNQTSALNHSYSYLRTIPPTCEDSGYDIYVCTCGTYSRRNYLPATNHNYISETVEPTETKQGYTHLRCLNCGGELYQNFVNPTGHDYVSTTVPATCTTGGYTSHICSLCGDEYIDGIVAAYGHKFNLQGYVLPSCTTEGLETYRCQVCGETKEEPVEMLQHNYLYSTYIQEPTCEERGYTVHTCSCGESFTDSYVEALGHSYNVTESKKVTCTEDGYITYQCDTCANSYTETVVHPHNGHVFELTEVVERTCEKTGYELEACARCGVKHYISITPLTGHEFGEWATTKTATTLTEGEKERYCLICNKVEIESIPKLYHNEHNMIFLEDLIQMLYDRFVTLIRSIIDSYRM